MRPSLFEKTPRSAVLQGSLVFIFIFLSFFLVWFEKPELVWLFCLYYLLFLYFLFYVLDCVYFSII